MSLKNLLLPKRVSELPPLESESDDEDTDKDPLNTNILDASFIEDLNDIDIENNKNCINSPAVFDDIVGDEEFVFNVISETKEPIVQNLKRSNSSTSRQLDFTNINGSNQQPTSKCVQPFSTKCTNSFNSSASALRPTETVQTSKSSGAKSRSLELIGESTLKSGVNTIENKATSKSAEIKTHNHRPSDEIENTPLKLSNEVFETPCIKFQMPTINRGSRMTTTTQKSRLTMEKEFRSQKILFTTPMSISRPLPSQIPSNDSLSLSIDDVLCGGGGREDVKRTLPTPPQSTRKIGEQSAIQSFQINEKLFEIKSKLGSGGSSSVFLASESKTNNEYAVKVVHLQGDKSVIESYLNETRLLAKLQGNINVIRLFEYMHLPNESLLYMVMEKGDSDLNKILMSHSDDVPLYELLNYWYQMLQSVEYIHRNGVIHSDLKPANFLMVNGRLKLIDFGIASNISFDSTSIIKYSQAGTFNYISPEALIDTSTDSSPAQHYNKPKIKISTKSDVWSLGCIFYLFLYQKTPFAHIKNIYAKVTAISNPNAEIEYPKLPIFYPPMLIEMVQSCLKHNPKQRSSVSELLKYPFNKIIKLNE